MHHLCNELDENEDPFSDEWLTSSSKEVIIVHPLNNKSKENEDSFSDGWSTSSSEVMDGQAKKGVGL